MNLQDNIVIKSNRKRVWDALNDPTILRVCIPGCTDLSGDYQNGFDATVNQKIGPVKATFTGKVTLSEVRESESYVISGEGKGGAAGFAKGLARVKLHDIAEGTKLSYEVEAKVGGKIAQLGARLIDGFAKSMAKKFFDQFKMELEKCD